MPIEASLSIASLRSANHPVHLRIEQVPGYPPSQRIARNWNSLCLVNGARVLVLMNATVGAGRIRLLLRLCIKVASI